MKEVASWKKVLFAIFAIVVLIRIGYIVNGDIDREYYTSNTVDLENAQTIPCSNIIQPFIANEARLAGIEFALKNIHEDRVGNIMLSITKGTEVVYQASLSLGNIYNDTWKNVDINYPLEVGSEYAINLNAVGCTQMPEIYIVDYECAAPEVVASYALEDIPVEQPAIKYGYLRGSSVFDRALNVIIWMALLAFVASVLYFFEVIYCGIKACWERILEKGNEDAIVIVSEVLCCLIILNTSGIVFQASTKIIFLIISICSAWQFRKSNVKIKEIVNKTWKRVCLYVLYVYSAFSLVGQRIFVYPLDRDVTIQGLFVFGVTIIWFVPVINSLIGLFIVMSKNCTGNCNKRISTPLFGGISVAFLLFPACLNLYANNPGISSVDSFSCMVENAHNIRGMLDWHPAFYCMILNVILRVWDSTYAVILVQYVYWAYVILSGLLYLRGKKMKDAVLLGIAFFLGTSAANFIHINTIWKDVPYAISILWLVIILTKLVLDNEEYKGKYFIYIELLIALINTFFFRKNGIVVFILVAVSLVIVFWKNKKVWIILALTIATIVTIKGPVYEYFEIQDPGKFGMYIGLGQDILGVYYAGGEISEETAEMINVMTSYNTAEYSYIPTWSYQAYDLDVDLIHFIKNYLDTFIKNPVLTIRAIIAREDAIWNIFIGEGTVLSLANYTGTIDGYESWNDYYPAREYNSFYDSMTTLTTYTATNQWISAIHWRCGVFTLLGIVAILLLTWVKGINKYMIVFVPIIGHILGLMLSTGWSDFRYFWPLNFMNLFVLLFSLVILNKENKVK